MRGGGDADPAALGELVQELLQKEESFAEQNAKRLRLVADAFLRDDFEIIVNIVDCLMQPLDALMNRFLQRTDLLRKMRFKETGDGMTIESLKQKSRAMFLRWVEGDMGWDAISHFLKNLKSSEFAGFCQMQPDKAAALSMTCFQLTVFAISDIWRRFCFFTQSFPWCLFPLISSSNSSESDFCSAWESFRRTLDRCPECVDVAFSRSLLREFDSAGAGRDNLTRCVQELRAMLDQIATYCPLATDTVESAHAQNQDKLYAWRGYVLGGAAAAEHCILGALASEHAHLKSVLDPEIMPSKMRISLMHKHVGRKRKQPPNMHIASRTKRFHAATKEKRRRLSPWNIFRREKLRAFGRRLSRAEFEAESKKIAEQWHQISDQERQHFKMASEYEQCCRDELVSRPLTPRLPKRACSCIKIIKIYSYILCTVPVYCVLYNCITVYNLLGVNLELIPVAHSQCVAHSPIRL